jgi:hypothetical protein
MLPGRWVIRLWWFDAMKQNFDKTNNKGKT